ncbi:LTA synthase family protein [Filimonas effusa]|uniref:Alkaline phosphatase family protein n=1 Tax=Filimonas effusa TaxID=2508721 RepID=A0A4Q1D0Y4_9BACT|nr:alkaline phosphatase family protein [Filimonas effusa]RXK80884.1 alkaline phosphatase family protein [Filimonas effusa]
MVKEIAGTVASRSRLFLHTSVFVLSLFLASRIFFHIYYHNSFSHISFRELLRIYTGGTYFDLSALAVQNVLFIIWMCIPVNPSWQKTHNRIGLLFFAVFNGLGLALNIFDIAFFDFSHKRLTAEIFHFGGAEDNFLALAPAFFKSYWYLIVVFIGFVLIIRYFSRRYIMNYRSVPHHHKLGWITGSILTLVLWMGLMLLNFRGWLALIPIDVTDAGKYATARNIPLVLNTPFTFAKSLGHHSMPQHHYFSDQEAAKHFSPYHNAVAGSHFNRKNVVVIALESFSKEFTALSGKQQSFTPFLDSLSKESLVFTQAWANGKQSIQGIPAILASVPSVMDGAFISSQYSGNDYRALASLLDAEQYYTAFFHGANNGSFNLDAFASQAGYHDYFGRKEYNNEADYDGNWGIWDEAFLQFAGKKMSGFPQPFHTAIFTLSSHHPFSVPQKYKAQFRGSDNPITKAVQYTDHSLRVFFNSIRNLPWFQNTIFVLTADHTGMSSDPFYSNLAGQYQIPVIIYDPSQQIKKEADTATLAQCDVMPTLLGLMGYQKPYFALGNNVKQRASFAVYYTNESYNMAQGDYLLSFNGYISLSLYNIRQDSLLQHNLLHGPRDTAGPAMEQTLKAYLQYYSGSIRANKMLYANSQAWPLKRGR